jgi:hypothetical protein
MESVFVLTAQVGSWDLHQVKILDIFQEEETALKEKARIEEEMSILGKKIYHRRDGESG